jgi:hypothetical protein
MCRLWEAPALTEARAHSPASRSDPARAGQVRRCHLRACGRDGMSALTEGCAPKRWPVSWRCVRAPQGQAMALGLAAAVVCALVVTGTFAFKVGATGAAHVTIHAVPGGRVSLRLVGVAVPRSHDFVLDGRRLVRTRRRAVTAVVPRRPATPGPASQVAAARGCVLPAPGGSSPVLVAPEREKPETSRRSADWRKRRSAAPPAAWDPTRTCPSEPDEPISREMIGRSCQVDACRCVQSPMDGPAARRWLTSA